MQWPSLKMVADSLYWNLIKADSTLNMIKVKVSDIRKRYNLTIEQANKNLEK